MAGADILAEVYERGARRWPTIALEEDDFTRIAGPHVAAADAPRDLFAEDLYVAAACVRGLDEGVAVFEAEMMPSALAALRRMRGPADRNEDVAQELRARLLVGAEGDAPKLAGYSGRGPLRRWLQVAAVRSYLKVLRAEGRWTGPDDRALADVAVASAEDPGLAMFEARYRDAFEQAFRRALDALEPHERTLLRFRFVDALPIAAICKMTGQHRATVHRRIAQVCSALAQSIEAVLSRELAMPRHELESARRLVRSRLQLSLARLLA